MSIGNTMKPVFQRGDDTFDCFIAAVARVLEVPLESLPTILIQSLVDFKATLHADLPVREREEQILQWWNDHGLPVFNQEFARAWNQWCKDNGLIFLILGPDAAGAGYSIQALEYRGLSHCKVLPDGQVIHDPNLEDLHPYFGLCSRLACT